MVHNLGKAAEDSFEDVLGVFAEFVAPLIGIIAGWVLGASIGGPATVGQLVYNVVQPTGVADPTKVADIVGGLLFGGIWAGLGGMLWHSSSRFGKKKLSSLVAMAAIRFFSGLAFGMAIQAVVSGFTGNVKSGWIDGLASDAEKAVA